MAVTKKKKLIITCNNCGKEMTANGSNFYKTKKVEYARNGGFHPICKNCMKRKMLNIHGEIEKETFRGVCRDFDIPFIPDIFEQAKEKNVDNDNQMNVLSDYRSTINISNAYKDLKFVDSIRYDYQNDYQEEYRQATLLNQITVPKETVLFWGVGLEPRLYEAYQAEYEMLCELDGGTVTGVKRNYFKNLAILAETAQQQLLDNDLKAHETTMKTYTSICEKCGINPKQQQDREEGNRSTFGRFIRMIEEEEPILEPERDLGSIDVVRRCLEVFFFGHLAEVNGWRNPLKTTYDETMQQYSVKTDTYEDLMAIEENDEEVEGKGFKRIFKVRKDKLGKLARRKSGE